MSNKIEHLITDEKKFRFIGCVFYGDPFHSAKEWTIENEIGKLWQRFMKLAFSRKNWRLISKFVNSTIGYEIHIEPEEYIETRKYYIFVGFELIESPEVPLEMFVKIFPKVKYLRFTSKARDLDSGEYYFKNWLPQSKYLQAYPYIIQAYDTKRFISLEDEKSEIDWYIPIKQKSRRAKN